MHKYQRMYNIIPLPASITPAEGVFALTETTGICVEPGHTELLALGSYLAGELQPTVGRLLDIAARATAAA